MNSHLDSDIRKDGWLRSLEAKADRVRQEKGSQITGGKPGESPLAEWEANGVGVRQLPPDEHGILRISIGGGETPVPLNYLVFRGDHGACVDLLRKALVALELGPRQ